MNLPTKYSFAAIKVTPIKDIAMDEYLLKSNREGGTEVILRNSITLNNTQGKKMKKITLKYPTTTAPSKEEKNEIVKSHSRPRGPFNISKDFNAFLLYAEESYEEYRNPIEELDFALLVSNAMSKGKDESMDNLMDDIENFTKSIHEAPADKYKNYNDEEKFISDLYDRLQSEVETRAYLQLAIDLADAPYEFYGCATLAIKLFGEEEVVSELYKKVISIEDPVLDFMMERDIKESNLNALQKNELLIQLRRETKSCS